MKLNNITEVQFLEYTHTYLFGDRQLMGVTSLMKKHGLSPDYGNVPSATLKNAAKLGTEAHKALENYIEGLPVLETNLIKSFRKLNLNIVETEYLVSDLDTVASSIDLLDYRGKNVYRIIDVKRTAQTHTKALAWQLGIYKYLFLKRNPKAVVEACFCLKIKKGSTENIFDDEVDELKEIEPVPAEKVEALLECERNGTIYCENIDKSNEGIVTPEQFALLSSRLETIAEYKAAIKEAEKEIEGIEDAVYEAMLAADKDEVEVGDMVIKLKRPFQRESFDSASFKKKYPELYEQFKKKTEVKGNISLTNK